MIRLIDKNAIKEFRALDSFIAKVMENASEQSKVAAINSLLNCSEDERYHIESEGQLDPFDIFTQREQAKVLYDKTYVEPATIEKLLGCSESSDTKHKAMIARLGKLNEWGKLSTDQWKQFGKVLWNNVGEFTGLPDLPNYYVHTFLQWAHPQDIDVKTAVKQYFFREEQKKRLFESVRMKSFGEVSVLKQLCILNENVPHFWEEEEIGHIISLLHDFWEEEKTSK